MSESTSSPRLTERDLLDRLAARHSQVSGNGPDWAFMEHVRDGAGFAGSTIDALAMHAWWSRQHELHAYEIKTSTADFRRELRDGCAKSASWRSLVDYFWIVAPAELVGIVEELPEDWGLLVTKGAGLERIRQASRLTVRPAGFEAGADLPRPIVAAMLRAQIRQSMKVGGSWRKVTGR